MSTDTAPAAEPFDHSEVVIEAQRLREYVMRLGKPDVSALVEALMPFESANATPPTGAQRETLFLAFQRTKSLLADHVDEYTINRVLIGRSPYTSGAKWRRWGLGIIRNLGVTVLGVSLVFLTLYYTAWSNTASELVLRFENFNKFDHGGEIMRLVEMSNAAGIDLDADLSPERLAGAQSDLGALDPQTVLVYEMVTRLNQHYVDQATLKERIRNQIDEFQIKGRIIERNCRFPVLEGFDENNKPQWDLKSPTQGWFGHTLVNKVLSCPNYDRFVLSPPVATGPVTAGASDKAKFGYDLALLNRVEDINELLEDEIYEITERNKIIKNFPYSSAVFVMQEDAAKLSNYIGRVHSWLLPIFYGMLGSVVYCLWRILNPPTAPLDFLYTVMRTAFAGLGALTLSMLILPANVLILPFETTRPVIYLMSFLFGYSIESFVNLLNALNRWLSSKISTKEAEDTPPGTNGAETDTPPPARGTG